jgi:hypothetical protein
MPKQPVSCERLTAAMDQIQAVLVCLSDVPNIVGPSYGAPMCDKASAVEMDVWMIALPLEDAFYRRFDGRIELAQKVMTDNDANERLRLAGVPRPPNYNGRRKIAPLNLAEHTELGIRLAEANLRLVRLLCDLSSMFPNTRGSYPDGVLVVRTEKAMKKLANLRSKMDTFAARDLGAAIFKPSIYYGCERELKPVEGMCRRYADAREKRGSERGNVGAALLVEHLSARP